MRVAGTRDQESKTVKFVFIVYVGPSVGGMQRGRVGAHKPDVKALVGQSHVDFQTDDKDDLTEESLRERLKKASGANYDLGSNAGGAYESKAGSIREGAAARYKTLEKESNIGPVIFDKYKKDRAAVTPMDLGGRAMVAPPTDAKKNIVLRDETQARHGGGDAARLELERMRAIEPKQPAATQPAAEASPGGAALVGKMARGESQFVVEAKPRLSRFETLEATFDEADSARERPPSTRRKAAAAEPTPSLPPKPPPSPSSLGGAPPAGLAPPPSASATAPPPSASATAPPPPPVEPPQGGATSGGGNEDDPLRTYADHGQVVLLYTSMTRDQLATVATRKVVTQLDGLGVDYVQLDGSCADHRSVRAALWALAGASPGTYPIMYVPQTGFVCKGGDESQDLIDSGELASKLGGTCTPRAAAASVAPCAAAPSALTPPTAAQSTVPPLAESVGTPPPAESAGKPTTGAVYLAVGSSSVVGLQAVAMRLGALCVADGGPQHIVSPLSPDASQEQVHSAMEAVVRSLEGSAAHLALRPLEASLLRLERLAGTIAPGTAAAPVSKSAMSHGELTAQLEVLVVRLEAAAVGKRG